MVGSLFGVCAHVGVSLYLHSRACMMSQAYMHVCIRDFIRVRAFEAAYLRVRVCVCACVGSSRLLGRGVCGWEVEVLV